MIKYNFRFGKPKINKLPEQISFEDAENKLKKSLKDAYNGGDPALFTKYLEEIFPQYPTLGAKYFMLSRPLFGEGERQSSKPILDENLDNNIRQDLIRKDIDILQKAHPNYVLEPNELLNIIINVWKNDPKAISGQYIKKDINGPIGERLVQISTCIYPTDNDNMVIELVYSIQEPNNNNPRFISQSFIRLLDTRTNKFIDLHKILPANTILVPGQSIHDTKFIDQVNKAILNDGGLANVYNPHLFAQQTHRDNADRILATWHPSLTMRNTNNPMVTYGYLGSYKGFVSLFHEIGHAVNSNAGILPDMSMHDIQERVLSYIQDLIHLRNKSLPTSKLKREISLLQKRYSDLTEKTGIILPKSVIKVPIDKIPKTKRLDDIIHLNIKEDPSHAIKCRIRGLSRAMLPHLDEERSVNEHVIELLTKLRENGVDVIHSHTIEEIEELLSEESTGTYEDFVGRYKKSI